MAGGNKTRKSSFGKPHEVYNPAWEHPCLGVHPRSNMGPETEVPPGKNLGHESREGAGNLTGVPPSPIVVRLKPRPSDANGINCILWTHTLHINADPGKHELPHFPKCFWHVVFHIAIQYT